MATKIPPTALIPLRSGSKRIPDKNIKLFNGKPLFYWAIHSAVASSIFQDIYVSTDSSAYKDLVNSYFPTVQFFDRSPASCIDTATTEQLMLEFLRAKSFQHLVLIQVTSPMTSSDCFKNAWEQYNNTNADSMYTGVYMSRFIWNESQPLNYDPLNRPRSQDFKGFIMENGAFYITSRDILAKYRCRLGGRIEPFLMDEMSVFEIDTIEDWRILESVLTIQ